MPSIFILGATGYIGAPLVEALLKEIPDLQATALVRNQSYAPTLSALKITTVAGSNDNLELITQLSSEADIVLNVADCDNIPLIEAILSGCKQRFESTGVKPLLIHTSGAAVNADKAEGKFNPDHPVFDDRNVEQIKNISPDALHRTADLRVVEADESGYVSGYIICPCTIYGPIESIIPRNSIQIPAMIKLAVLNKKVIHAGDGSNIWNFIHRKDLISLYLTVFKHALSGEDQGKGWEKFYFATGPEHAWIEVAKKVATILYDKGLIDQAEPASVPIAEFPMIGYYAWNSRAISGRATDLGWKPTAPSVFDELLSDVDSTLAA